MRVAAWLSFVALGALASCNEVLGNDRIRYVAEDADGGPDLVADGSEPSGEEEDSDVTPTYARLDVRASVDARATADVRDVRQPSAEASSGGDL